MVSVFNLDHDSENKQNCARRIPIQSNGEPETGLTATNGENNHARPEDGTEIGRDKDASKNDFISMSVIGMLRQLTQRFSSSYGLSLATF